jgi:hypothetical protein
MQFPRKPSHRAILVKNFHSTPLIQMQKVIKGGFFTPLEAKGGVRVVALAGQVRLYLHIFREIQNHI